MPQNIKTAPWDFQETVLKNHPKKLDSFLGTPTKNHPKKLDSFLGTPTKIEDGSLWAVLSAVIVSDVLHICCLPRHSSAPPCLTLCRELRQETRIVAEDKCGILCVYLAIARYVCAAKVKLVLADK